MSGNYVTKTLEKTLGLFIIQVISRQKPTICQASFGKVKTINQNLNYVRQLSKQKNYTKV